VEVDQTGDRGLHSVSPPGHTGGIAVADSEKAEALAEILVAQFQLVTDPSAAAVIEMVDAALKF
jgi:hypothetical protein